MRIDPRLPTLLTLLALLAARPGSAQTADLATPQVPTARSLWFDAGALLEDQVRFGVEAVPLRRFTIGLAIASSHTMHPRDEVWPPPYDYAVDAPLPQCDPRMLSLCAYPPYPYGYGEPTHYRAWAFDLAARYYPEALSFRNGDARMMVYAGAYAGYHWRTWEERPWSYYCPPGYLCPMPAVPEAGTPADSAIVIPLYPPYPVPYPAGPVRHTLKGLQPGLELGVRLLPAGPLFLEVGGRFTLVVVDDRMQRIRPGDVDAQLVLAGGLAW